MRRPLRAALLLGTAVPLAGLAAPPRPEPVRFVREIQPLLSDNCFACHGPDRNQRQADLRLDTADGLRRAFVAGKLDASPGWKRLTATDPALRMPPPSSNHVLSPLQIARIRQWILAGAQWEQHWSFVKPERPRGASNLDAFVRAKLREKGLAPSPEADRRTLMRRVSLDLTGLPPTPQEVDAFVTDARPDAYERVVDRLLASPRYGERMVWDWLEASRYADSNGFQEDRTRTSWPWRDWVVDAFNANKPFDQFAVEQIAGDLLPGATREQTLATGFNRNHPLNGEGGRIPEESRIDYVMDRVETVSTVFLGVTMGCSKCHDHKFDPFTRRDYYRLFDYFNQVPESGSVDAGGNAQPVLSLATPAQQEALAAAAAALTTEEKALAALAKDAPERAAQEKKVNAAKAKRDAADNAILKTMVMAERPQRRESFMLVRGLYEKREDKVTCGTPAVLNALPADAPQNRLALARWLVSPENPLTARVTVNRFWQMLFGVGLVKTSEDFGVQGERPSHPELLDWLAVEFMESGWNVKRLLKSIVMSATYRQSSVSTAAQRAADPENRLLSHGPRYRLPSWMLRDQALAASGLLVEKRGGPPVLPYQPAGIWEEYSFGRIGYQQSRGEDLYRRSVYTYWRRAVAPTNLFDTAARTLCTVRTGRTNTPLHALTLLNDPTFVEAARALAERSRSEGGPRPEGWIAAAFRHAAGRSPRPREADALVRLYRKALSVYASDRDAARKRIAVGQSAADKNVDPLELAALATVTETILNLDETQSKE